MSLAEYGGNPHPGESSDPFDIIGLPAGDVLPRMEAEDLCEPLRRVPDDELAEVLRTRLLPLVSLPGLKLHVACGAEAQAEAQVRGRKLSPPPIHKPSLPRTGRSHGSKLLVEATSGLARRTPMLSASRRLTPAQSVGFAAGLAWLAVGLIILPGSVMWSLLSLFSGFFFLGVVALRVLCLLPPKKNLLIRPQPLEDSQLPTYSVLVPLFRETSVLGQLLDALTALDYPRHLLDIKLILEETDTIMQRAVAGLRLPPEFEVIVVPSGKPQTKPRALNYAFQFCRGELLTIYDAEDIPEHDQLRKAAECFALSAPDVACLQAQLTFYNPDENWLTRQFTLEYASLFGILLPVLANHRLPLLLGGTSNHFRSAALQAAGGWDPYNVTEDADLGLRLARLGYDCATLDSFTHEEANTRLLNWMKQRARWLKGFLATWFVHMREPLAFLREVGPAGFWAAQDDAGCVRVRSASSALHGRDHRSVSAVSDGAGERAAGRHHRRWP